MRVAYVDIETNYVGPHTDQKLFSDFANHKVTVLGIRVIGETEDRFVQLVGEEISRESILTALEGVEKLVTYNGRSVPDAIKGRIGFDFPVLEAQYGIALDKQIAHVDLVPECWKRNWYGGQKKVEERLGLKRALPGKDGLWANQQWREYQRTGNRATLAEMLLYNKEDVYQLREIEQRMGN